MAELSPSDLEIGESPAHEGQAVGLIERFSEAEPFLAVGDPFLELSPVGESPSEITPSYHGRKSNLTKPFPAQTTFKPLQDFAEKILGPSIVPRPDAGHAEVEISRHLERNLPKRLGNSLGALAIRKRFLQITSFPEVVAHIDGELAESPLIVECPRQAFGFAETAGAPLEFSEWKECSSKVEAKIDGLLQRLVGLRQMRQGRQRLLEADDRLSIGRPREGFGSGLPEVGQRLSNTRGRGGRWRPSHTT